MNSAVIHLKYLVNYSQLPVIGRYESTATLWLIRLTVKHTAVGFYHSAFPRRLTVACATTPPHPRRSPPNTSVYYVTSILAKHRSQEVNK